jgi:NAD(P)-dependent dehydrogenase (short-subunit alcohol dehydrogenase family)
MRAAASAIPLHMRRCSIFTAIGRVDILVNNAGQVDPGLTDQGLSATFQADYLGAYMLTTGLYDLIRSTRDARVVNVSSPLHHYGRQAHTRI